MNYSLLIEERKSTRTFADKPVPESVGEDIKRYHDGECMRLVPEIDTEVYIADAQAKESLEGAAGYKEFLAGAPSYMVLLSGQHEYMGENAGYITEDISLKLNDMGYGACFVTFTDADAIKSALGIGSEKTVAAILAFGIPQRAKKKLHFNLFTMSGISAKEKQQYFAPKKGVEQLTFLDSYGSEKDVFEYVDLHEDVLWDPLLAASNSPSYMNRQPYAFVIKDDRLTLVSLPDEFTGEIDEKLNLGVVMQHFASTAKYHRGNAVWSLEPGEVEGLPEGARVVAVFDI